MTTPYSAGTISLTNGSAVVTGIGTAWQTALIVGGTIYVQAAGNPLPILIVDGNTQITAALKWTGATGTYSYALIRDTAHDAQLVANATALARLLAGMEAGTIFKYNAEGDTAGRSFYDGRPKGFAYLDISVNPAQLWIKSADAAGNWAGPFAYAQGAQGIPGPAGLVNWRGNYAAGTAYARNDAVYHNGSAFIALQATTGNAPPVLPTTSNAWWSVMAVKGSDGAGTGDVKGPSEAVTDRIAVFSGTTGKLLKDGGKTLSELGGGAAEEISYDPQTSGLLADNVQAAIDEAVAKAMRLPIGMTLTNSVSLPNTSVNISAGRRRSLDDDADIVLPSTISKRLDAVWAPGTGNGGLDTGAKANSTWYHVFAICNPTTGATDGLFSTSPTAPVMPPGFTQKVRRGAIMTDGSGNIRAFRQVGGWFHWLTPIIDFTNVAIGAAQNFAISVPAGIKVLAEMGFVAQASTGNTNAFLGLCDPDIGAASTAHHVMNFAAAPGVSKQVFCFVNSTRQISVQSSNGGLLAIYTRGWFDNLDTFV